MDALSYCRTREAGMRLMAKHAEPGTPRQKYWQDRADWYAAAAAALEAQSLKKPAPETPCTPEPANT